MLNDFEQGRNSNLYLNVVVRINADWEKLHRHLEEMDTKVAYLRIFEMSLSPACAVPLWDIPEYQSHAKAFPLPADPFARLDFESFRAQMAVYELVMRDQGLIGTKKTTIIGLDDPKEVVN